MESITHWLGGLEFSQLIWLLPAAVTIHMVEEMIWLPAWSRTAGSWHIPVSSRQFAIASIILLVVIFALTAAVDSPIGNVAQYLTAGLALTFLFNIYFPHVGATIALRRYCPGLITALLINLPLMPFLIWQAVVKGHLDILLFLLLAAPMVAAAAAGWSLLLNAGSILLK